MNTSAAPPLLLVRATNWLGDAVLNTVFLRALGTLYPGVKRVVVAIPRVAPIFQGHPDGEELLVIDPHGSERGVLGHWRMMERFRRYQRARAYVLPNSFHSAFLFAAARVRERVGYARDGRSWLLTERVAVQPDLLRVHQVWYYLHLLGIAPGEVADFLPRLVVGDKERADAVARLREWGVTPEHLLLGISPGAEYGPAKRWPPERFAAVANELLHRQPGRALIFGSAGDRAAAQQVAAQLMVPYQNLAGETSLRQFLALTQQCRLFLTNDNGAMHAAAALGVPTVAIFGSTNPLTTGPLGPRVKVIQEPTLCAPCLKRECPLDFRCMLEVNAERVLREILDFGF